MKCFILVKGKSPRAENILQLFFELNYVTKIYSLKNNNYFKIFVELKKFKPDVVFVLNGPDLIALPVLCYKLFNKVKFIWDVRSTSSLNAKNIFWYYPIAVLLEKIIPKFADKITTNIYKYHKKYGWSLLPQYVNTSVFNSNIKSNLKYSNKKIILFIGHLVKKEGLEFLINSFKNCLNKDIELWICGHGKDENYFKKLGMSDYRIKFKGFINHNLIPEYIKISTICVVPYANCKEISYTSLYSVLKIGEYLAMSKSILCSNVGDLKLTAKNTNILFYDSNNMLDFLTKLNLLLKKPVTTKLSNFLKKDFVYNKLSELL